MRQNITYAIRGLVKSPTFTLAALLCLTLGIGATTAVFSVVNAVVLRPFPYVASNRLVRLYTEFPTQGPEGHKFWFSEPEIFDLQKLQSFSAIGVWAIAPSNISGGRQPIRITTAYVNADALSTLGVKPALGRLINHAEDAVGAARPVVLSDALWRNTFGGDPAIIGRQVYLNDEKSTVVGVMPAGFVFPPGETEAPQAWSSLQLNPLSTSYGNHFFSVFGRLRDGVSTAQAKAELGALVARLGEAESAKHHVLNPRDHPLSLYNFSDEVVGKVRKSMMLLLAAVALVLLIACVNVANLLLARSEARHREIAIRRAIGASDRHLLRQFILEGTILSFAGAVLGMGLAYGALDLLRLVNAGNIPRASEINIDWRVLVFTLITTIVTGVLFGLAPLVHVSAIRVFDTLKSATTRVSGTVASNRFRRVLVVFEMAMAFVLLSTAALMIQGFWKLQEVNPGFSANRLLTMSVSLPDKTYRDANARVAFWTRTQSALAQIPGVQSATIMFGLPPIRPVNQDTTEFENMPKISEEHMPEVAYYQVAGDAFFKTLQVPLLEGRFLEPQDGDKNSPGVVVNSALAREYWPHTSAIGRRLRPNGNGPWYRVAGVVGDVKNHGLDQPAETEVFFPYRLAPFGAALLESPNIVLRTQGDPLAMTAAVRRVVSDIDPNLPVAKVQTMESVISQSTSRPRFLTVVLGLFSAIALGLAVIGIYGVISYSVEQRTAEFGIKMAIGARPSALLFQVLRQGLVLAAIGIVAGFCAASFLTEALRDLVFGIGSQDYVSLLLTAFVLAVATLAACVIPATRAMRLDPVIALRYE